MCEPVCVSTLSSSFVALEYVFRYRKEEIKQKFKKRQKKTLDGTEPPLFFVPNIYIALQND